MDKEETYLSKEPFLRKVEMDIQAKRPYHSQRTVIAPNKELTVKLGAKNIEKIREYLNYAKKSFNLLEEIADILEHEVKEDHITYRLAGSAIQTEIKVLPRVLKMGFKWCISSDLEEMHLMHERDLMDKAKSEGLWDYLALDFFKLWRKFTLKNRYTDDVVGAHLKFYKENREQYIKMIKELESILKANTEVINDDVKEMNTFK